MPDASATPRRGRGAASPRPSRKCRDHDLVGLALADRVHRRLNGSDRHLSVARSRARAAPSAPDPGGPEPCRERTAHRSQIRDAAALGDHEADRQRLLDLGLLRQQLAQAAPAIVSLATTSISVNSPRSFLRRRHRERACGRRNVARHGIRRDRSRNAVLVRSARPSHRVEVEDRRRRGTAIRVSAGRRSRRSLEPPRQLTLEWQVSSPPPIFNFDSMPTVVGGPYEYGFRERSTPYSVTGRRSGVRRRARDGDDEGMSAANDRDTCRGQRDDWRAPPARVAGAEGQDRAVAGDPPRDPPEPPASRSVIYVQSVRDTAQVRLDLALTVLHELGFEATGEVGDSDPFQATMDAIGERKPDEIVISTLPRDGLGLAAPRPRRACRRGVRHRRSARDQRPRRRQPAAERHDACGGQPHRIERRADRASVGARALG